jgi:hypothetical protein
LTTVHMLQSQASGVLHPEQLPTHRLDHDCVHLLGYPDCYGAACLGDDHCTCHLLTVQQHEQCEREAQEHFETRGGKMCHDCAFRKGSPEEEKLEQIAIQDEPFHCHQGMPVRAIGGVPQKDSYSPRGLKLYPVCAGWQRAHAAALAREAQV